MNFQQRLQDLTQPLKTAFQLAKSPEVIEKYFTTYEMFFEPERCRKCSKSHTEVRTKFRQTRKCSNCECTYHPQCAKDLQTCINCSKGQLVNLTDIEREYFTDVLKQAKRRHNNGCK